MAAAPDPLDARLLGPPALAWRGRPLAVRSRKESALLYHLALRPGGVRKEAIAELLWGPGRRGNLRVALHHLRRLPGADVWLIDDDPVALRATSDLARFELAVHDDPEAALAAWDGLPDGVPARSWLLHGVDLAGAPAFADWLEVERERVAAAWADALLRAAERAEQEERYADAARRSRRLLADDPLHETATRALMRAAWLSGDREGAVAAFERCRRALAAELGLEPLEETRALLAQVRAGPSAPRPVPPRATPPHPTAIPDEGHPTGPGAAAFAAIVGRRDERARVRDALTAGRVVTLVGLGGIGKTRLADHVADAWTGVVARVPLGSLTHVGDVAPAVLSAVGGGTSRGSAGGTLATAIGRWALAHATPRAPALLLLDEAEAVLAGVVDVVEAARGADPGVAVLVTSRVELDVPNEAVVRLDGLEDEDAVALFERFVADRAPGFALSDDERAAAVALVRAVDGSPLALALAASWVPEVTVAEVAAGVGAGLAAATATLDGPGDDAAALHRHASLRAALAHSWHLLTDAEQAGLAHASVFPGGFDPAAAAAVAGADRRTLLALVRKSMLQRDRAGRFRLHAVVRLYAAEALEQRGERTVAERRHGAWALGPLLAGLRRPGPTWVIDADAARLAFDDLRAAWDRCVGDDPAALTGAIEPIAAVVDQLGRWRDADAWFARAEERLAGVPAAHARPLRAALGVARARADGLLRGPEAALARLDAATDALEAATPRTRAEAARVRGHALHNLARHEDADAWLTQAAAGFEVVGDDRALASTINLQGLVARDRLEPARAVAAFERVQAIAERADLPVARGAALANLAGLHPPHRPLAEPIDLLTRAADALREAGFVPALAATLGNLGERLQDAGLPGARAAFAEAVALYDELGVPACAPLLGLAEASDPEERRRFARRAIDAADAIDDARSLAFGHALLARLAADEGDPREAGRRFEAAVASATRADPVARTHVLRDRARWYHAQGARDAALADLVAALEAAMAARSATPPLLIAHAAAWSGAHVDDATARVLRLGLGHARAVGWPRAITDLRGAAADLGLDVTDGDADAAWHATLAAAARDVGPGGDQALGQRVLDVLYAAARAYDLPRRVASWRIPSGTDRKASSAPRTTPGG
jgi:DNA-binding SARP family transcriptional activator/predicted ATPase